MERIPEADLMDTVEQAKAYAETDFSEAHDAFVVHFKSKFPDFAGGSVLDLGCGTADVIIRFARTFPNAIITGIDGAQAMLDIGMSLIDQKDLSHQIKIKKCLLPDAELASKRFDAVISNSLLHHLVNPAVLWDTVLGCSGKGSSVFVMDLMRPDSSERARELVRLHAGDTSPVLQEDFYNSLLAAYREHELADQLKAVDLDYLSIDVVSDRHLLVWGSIK